MPSFVRISLANLAALTLLVLPTIAQQSQSPAQDPGSSAQPQKLNKEQKQKLRKTLKELDSH